MGAKQEAQATLFYEFSLEDHVPQDHLLRFIDRFVDLSTIRARLATFYSHTGRPLIDPKLRIGLLLVGYCFGIRSEWRLCDEVHLNLAYRWFCNLNLTDRIPDHSTFSKNRHGRFHESDLLRHVFEMTVARCIKEGLVGGHGLATKRPMGHFIRASFGAGAMFASFAAVARLNVAEAILIAQLSPILMSVAAVWLLRERLTVWRIGGVAFGFAGVVVMVWPELGSDGASDARLFFDF